MNQVLKEIGDHVASALPDDVVRVEQRLGELMVTVNAGSIVRVLSFLRDDSQCEFKVLVDVCGVDWPQRERRFEVVYNLLSVRLNLRIRVKLETDAQTPVPTATGVFPSAGWYEREAWDLYGIMFSDHADLRRILTDYGFEGHPLRKDFPLTGHVEVRYDDELKRVVYEPVKLTQDFRRFDFLSPWEGMNRLLPGDEKAAPPPAAAPKN
jgi:NADH-quinone oxidoreductase subunit C